MSRHEPSVEERTVPNPRARLPGRGNPMRPILILVSAAFGVMLIVFPVVMRLAGVGTAGTVGVALMIVATAALSLAMLRMLGGAYERSRVDLLGGEALATWRLAPDERGRFVAGERRRFGRQAAAYALAGPVLGAIHGAILDDALLGLIVLAVFLATATLIATMVRPPLDGKDRDVVVGPRGVQVLDRFLPLRGPGTRLEGVLMEPGDPAVLRLDVRTGRRVEEVRVPVPQGHESEAAAVAERLRSEIE